MSTLVKDLVSYLQAGASISLNDAIYIDSATGKIFKFDPTNPALVFAGIAKQAGVLNDYIKVVQAGRVSGFVGLTAGQPVYASVTVPGSFQLTAPVASQSTVLGIAKSSTELVINGGLGIKPGGVGTGGTGGINYTTDGDAESGIGLWVTYADAAGVSPVDGTGGAPTVTLAVSSVSPLRGTSSFLFTKTAVNSQGQGFSRNFTIDDSDKGKVLQCSFDYQIASGTFADNDLSVWIYDVTNATLIQPAPYLIKNSGVIEKFAVEFQTAINSNSYRLIVHIGNTGALAYTVKFDNFIVGPQAKLYGSPITDPVSVTYSLSNAGNATVSGTVAKEGSFAVFEGLITIGSSLPTGNITLNLPAGYSLSTSADFKNSSISASVGATGYTASAYAVNATSFNFYGPNTAVWNATVPITWAAGNSIKFSIKAPISGWSSSQVMSSDADTRVVAAQAHGTVTGGTGNGVIIVYPTVSYDTHGAYSASTGQFTAPSSGYYRISGFANATTTIFSVFAYVGGVKSTKLGITNTGNGPFGGTVYALAGQTIDIRPDTAISTSGPDNWLSIEKTQGPAQIMASESVNAVYTTAAGQSIPNASVTIINFDTKETDSHNSVTTGASWKFTAPMSGKYLISSITQYASATYNNGTIFQSDLYKNGVVVANLGYFVMPNVTTNLRPYLSGSRIVQLLAGEYIDIRTFQNNGGASVLLNSSQYNHLSITRVGN